MKNYKVMKTLFENDKIKVERSPSDEVFITNKNSGIELRLGESGYYDISIINFGGKPSEYVPQNGGFRLQPK